MNEFYAWQPEAQSVGEPATRITRKILFVMSNNLFAEALNVLIRDSGRVCYESGCTTIENVQASLATASPPDLIVVATISESELSDVVSKFRLLRPAIPETKWLLLGERIWPEQLREALSIGIDGFLLHGVSAEILKLSIDLIFLGQTVLPRDFTQALEATRSVRKDALADADIARHNVSLAEGEVGYASGALASDRFLGTTIMRSVPSGYTTLNSVATAEGASTTELAPILPGSLVANGAAMVVGRTEWPLDHNRSSEISERERQILDCLVAGHSNKAIARLLNIAEATVKVHIKALLRKMHVSNRTQAAISALHQRERLKTQPTNLVNFVAANQILGSMSQSEDNTRPAAEAVCPM